MAGYAEYDEAGRERARPGVDPGMPPPPREGNFEIHVKFKNGMWWAMPRHLSEPLLELWRNGDNQCTYVWDWGEARAGSYVGPEGEETSLNRYIIDFVASAQYRQQSRSRNQNCEGAGIRFGSRVKRESATEQPLRQA